MMAAKMTTLRVWEEVSMKDLLADLQVDDNDTGAGWLSLEQLEQEPRHLSIITMPCECWVM
jgi:hypothetical protein